MKSDAFSTYNPILNFTFFIGVIILTMCFGHPLYLLCSAFFAASYSITIKGLKAFKLIGGLLILFIAVSLINPLFSTGGNTVLWTYLGGRTYTLEALCYGMSTGAMVFTVMLWFSSYNTVMTSDKFIYLFGRMIPSLSLVLSMVLRLVPSYQRKTVQIAGARKGIGKSVAGADRKEKVGNGMTILSVLTSWALEGAVVTADSMRSRGYGCGKRTSFSIYRFDVKDKLLLALMLLMIGGMLYAAAMGATAVTWIPAVRITPVNSITRWIGIVAYGILTAIPTVLNIKEKIIWHVLRSKI